VPTRAEEPLLPPPLAYLVLEQGRTALELAALHRRQRLRASAPRGDGHPVLVLPGFLAGDLSTALLRRFLRGLGYDAEGWGLGVNLGPTRALRASLRERLCALGGRQRRRVSLIGWSLGGIYARELARAEPERVRLVVTMASPFRDVSATRVASLFPRRSERRDEDRDRRAALRQPIPVPSTAIYSRSDGIVAWQSCLEDEGPQRENVEVACSHTGMGFHAAALAVVADRLALPEGGWRPYRKADVPGT
jgi:pimeloyl-ACP methyl ester carboxylesterase